ncbi:hypothetical protein DCC81_12025 [Chitinophaga parva]|uniref:Uncharacterized protein n=1 Tax=Chitinophaga parva TaxID=2169414 RepID=A0A2T7BFI4_9BACT|nr:hypothetical protein [Chitinophaga parva]PUZ25034.1 hypothetical protein DCC81_12025 [Chitinophaga parva]
MKLQDQVCTLEQGKRLAELGITASPKWMYFNCHPHSGLCLSEMPNRHMAILTGHFPLDPSEYSLTPAFTVAELGQMLPDQITQYIRRESNNWWVGLGPLMAASSSEADARAQALIYLLETNQLTADEANKRLMQ